MTVAADGRTQLTLRIPLETEAALNRLFHIRGGYATHGKSFRTFVAAFLAENAARADAEIEILKKALDALEKEPPPPPPLPPLKGR